MPELMDLVWGTALVRVQPKNPFTSEIWLLLILTLLIVWLVGRSLTRIGLIALVSALTVIALLAIRKRR
jgi:hypothetical protein